MLYYGELTWKARAALSHCYRFQFQGRLDALVYCLDPDEEAAELVMATPERKAWFLKMRGKLIQILPLLMLPPWWSVDPQQSLD